MVTLELTAEDLTVNLSQCFSTILITNCFLWIVSPSIPFFIFPPCFSPYLSFFLQCTWWRTGEETTPARTRAWRPAGQLCVAAVSSTCWHNYSPIPVHPLAPHFCASNPITLSQSSPSLSALYLALSQNQPSVSSTSLLSSSINKSLDFNMEVSVRSRLLGVNPSALNNSLTLCRGCSVAVCNWANLRGRLFTVI